MSELLVWLGGTPLAYPFLPATLLFLPVVLTSLAIAIVLSRRRGAGQSLREFLLPARIYRSPDFRVDLTFFLVNRTVYPMLVLLWVFQARSVIEPVAATLEAHGIGRPDLIFGTGPLLLFTVLIFLARDFGTFLAHWLHHRIPLLWEFHKVHHTTRALTPFSAFRAHPVDDLVTISLSEVLAAPVLFGFVWAYGDGVGAWTILGVHGFVLLFRTAGYHLRHSHLWLSFGPRWGRILISPAAHQIHHSRDPRHWDRNMGKILAIWDGLFGTLYVPGREAEELEYGVSDEVDARYDSIPRLYLRPFEGCLRQLRALGRSLPHRDRALSSRA
ncbi:MAG: sterol desaturase family protein [Myxococcota bacterium]